MTRSRDVTIGVYVCITFFFFFVYLLESVDANKTSENNTPGRIFFPKSYTFA